MEQLVNYIELLSYLDRLDRYGFSIPLQGFGLHRDDDGWYVLMTEYKSYANLMNAPVSECYTFLDCIIHVITGIDQIKVKYSTGAIHWWSWNGCLYLD